jgi:prepilin-type N-terminal cleavage/methylation domain-containing protein
MQARQGVTHMTPTKTQVLEKNTGSKGFTLIEVLMALAIFTIGILAIGSLQFAAIKGDSKARFSTEAAVLAQDTLERLIALRLDPDAAQLPAEFRSDLNNDPSRPFEDSTGKYTVDWIVSPLHTPINNAVTIDMTVTWLDRGYTRSITYNYVKTADLVQ